MFEENVRVGMVYREQIHKNLTVGGLTLEDADSFLREATKGCSVDHLRTAFTGIDGQWELMVKHAPNAVCFSHAILINNIREGGVEK